MGRVLAGAAAVRLQGEQLEPDRGQRGGVGGHGPAAPRQLRKGRLPSVCVQRGGAGGRRADSRRTPSASHCRVRQAARSVPLLAQRRSVRALEAAGAWLAVVWLHTRRLLSSVRQVI